MEKKIKQIVVIMLESYNINNASESGSYEEIADILTTFIIRNNLTLNEYILGDTIQMLFIKKYNKCINFKLAANLALSIINSIDTKVIWGGK